MTTRQQIGLDSIVAQNEELVTSTLDGDTVMMNIASGKYYGLNAIGSRIWELIATPRSVLSLRDSLLEEFSASCEQIEKSLQTFLNKMEEEGIIQIFTE